MTDGGGTLDTDELGEAFDFMGVENWDVEGLMYIVENNGAGEVLPPLNPSPTSSPSALHRRQRRAPGLGVFLARRFPCRRRGCAAPVVTPLTRSHALTGGSLTGWRSRLRRLSECRCCVAADDGSLGPRGADGCASAARVWTRPLTPRAAWVSASQGYGVARAGQQGPSSDVLLRDELTSGGGC